MAHEHVLIDYPLSVAALSPGINIFNIVGTVPALYPEKFNDQTAWMRLTLSEIPSPKLSGRNYGDGRGPATGYRLGETEDYRLPAPDSASKSDIVIEHDGHFDPHYELPTVVWDIIYRNEGLTTARNVDIIHKLLDVSDARLVEVRAPGLSGNQIRPDKNQILFNIGDVAPGEWGRFIIKWQVPLGLSTVSATVTATSDNEGNPSNNEATATATIVEAPLHFGFRTADDLPLSCRGTTCQNRVDLIGKGQPGATIYILHAPVRRQADRTAEYQVVGKTQVATNGTWSYVIAELNAGVNLVGANYSGEGQPLAIVTIRYDAELPFDPNSFRVEHKEQSLQPDTFGHTWDALQIPNSFDEVTLGMNACGKQSDILFTYGDQAGQSVLLTDEDQDGRFEGQLKLMNGLTVASVQESLNFTLSTTNGTVETSFDGAIERLSTGVVRNRTNNAPVKNATVTLFENHSGRNADGSIDPSTLTMVQLDQEYGQVNPQTTDENGTFVLSAPSGLMQLTVTLDGYQPYRTSAFETDSGLIDASLPQSQILLTPVVTEQTTHFVQLSNAGFEPATLAVLPGSIVEFINIDSAMHSVQGKFGDSGLLAIGESYKVRFVDEGTFSYRDGENPLHLGTISVDADTPAPTDEPDETNDGQVFLPLVLR
ncbi:hypothetical protein KFU94_03365 [Chloroflexi bacterium TSY]|nr:hypothetical protein [Chloroflexi bacterium TSY]